MELQSKKKDVEEKKDKQKQKVYNMDHELSVLLKNKLMKIKLTETDYLKIAAEIFSYEGFNDYEIIDNKSKTISNINVYQSRLSFSNKKIKEKCIEVILHELAHSITYLKSGYNGVDAHSEIFVFNLFNLIKKYFHVSDSELESIAKKHKVSYVKNLVLQNKDITKEEFDSFIQNNKIKNCIKSKIIESKNKKNICYVGYNISNESCLSISKSTNCYFLFEREMYEYEKIYYINKYRKERKKKLNNYKLFSPVFKVNQFGHIMDNGKHYMFCEMNSDKAKNKDFKNFIFNQKITATRQRKIDIENSKKEGFNVNLFKDYKQYDFASLFYLDVINTRN